METVFALPGFGRALVKAALERDVNLSFILVLIASVLISIVLFISSLLTLGVEEKGESVD